LSLANLLSGARRVRDDGQAHHAGSSSRRGARLRLNEEDGWDANRPTVYKAERLAMEEVKHNLVLYEVPPPKPATA